MTLMCDTTIGEGESVPPDTKFRKSWKVQNSGTEPWPEGVTLTFTSGAEMGERTSVPVPCLPPKETIEISIDLKSPSVNGVYQSKWRMTTSNGSYFGGNNKIIQYFSCGGCTILWNELVKIQKRKTVLFKFQNII